MTDPALSLVMAGHNEGANLRSTLDNLLETAPSGSEVIVVDDRSTDGSADFLAAGRPGARLLRPARRLGQPAARNLGASAAAGDVIVFCEAGCTAAPGWSEAMRGALDQPEVGMVGPAVRSAGDAEARGFGRTWADASLTGRWLARTGDGPYAVPLLPGCFLAVPRDLFEQVGGFDDRMLVAGDEAAELCVRTWCLGYESRVVPAAGVVHWTPPALPEADRRELVVHDGLRLATVHLARERLARMIEQLSGEPAFPAAMARVLDGDASERRARQRSVRQRDDGSFFARFGIDVLD